MLSDARVAVAVTDNVSGFAGSPANVYSNSPTMAPHEVAAAATSLPSYISFPPMLDVHCATANGDICQRKACSTTMKQVPTSPCRCFGTIFARAIRSASRIASSMLCGIRTTDGEEDAGTMAFIYL